MKKRKVGITEKVKKKKNILRITEIFSLYKCIPTTKLIVSRRDKIFTVVPNKHAVM